MKRRKVLFFSGISVLLFGIFLTILILVTRPFCEIAYTEDGSGIFEICIPIIPLWIFFAISISPGIILLISSKILKKTKLIDEGLSEK